MALILRVVTGPGLGFSTPIKEKIPINVNRYADQGRGPGQGSRN